MWEQSAGGRGPASVRQRFAGHPAEAGEARGFLRSALGGSPLAEVAELLLSELVTNALRHTASGRPGGSFEVAYSHGNGLVRVEVCDEGSPTRPERLTMRPDATTGRGLVLVDALADQWGVRGDERSRTVWFELVE